MIQWLINAPFYSALSFESGVTSGAISILISQVGLILLNWFSPSTPTQASTVIVRTLRKIVQPIRQFELLLTDPNYGQAVKCLSYAMLALFLALGLILHKLMQERVIVKKSGSGKLHKEAKRLLQERKTFINKVDQLEKLNKRYREAVFLAEKSYNEEHKLKRLEEKRLQNLEKYMEKCSQIIATRREKLDDTLRRY